ncbi:amidohydrolase family protein [Sphingomonas baiyangensis]|uniref:Amidohydrolase n=1 Tax=Sphingomonas baiyangensis TaxID=2572576 RepID=A0A4U1L0X0_9SPHN|nr:amidohydrolase family protein [Sphingomonas baiyangensis]TKD50421.1 amidohydrolase [Sphingomonas baiyangensis]
MLRTTASLAAIAFLLGTAHAQQQNQPPVEATEAPEDLARDAEQPDPLPQPQPQPQPTPATTPPVPAAAVDKKAKWDVNAPAGAAIRQVNIDVDEGSWMDLDVSPDGRTLAFTLLGDIYTMPITGGTPTRIAEGLAWEVHPRFSPDGRRIAFTSDRAGGDNIWVMNADGSDKRQVTKEDFRLLNQPTWSPDGRFIVAKKHFTTGRSLGTGEVWLYHVSGGTGVKLVKRPNEQHQKELGEPIFAPDGRYVYFTRNVTPGPIFEYAQDSNTNLFNIERYDLETGETTTAVSGNGGSVRPTPSRDGSKIAFVRREATRSKLYVRDLASGVERKVYDDLDQDVQETWAVTGLYPNMAWMPGDREIVLWAGGKLRRVDVESGAATDIPFRVRDTRGVAAAPHPQIAVAPERFATKMPRFASVSPDGRQVVFESLGKLYVKPAAGGAARRLTRGGEGRELFPAWSRDGRSIAYVDWTDAAAGRIMTVPASGGNAQAVTQRAGHYARPAWSPDGRTIAFEARRSRGIVTRAYGMDPGIYRVATSGGVPTLVMRGAGNPQFGAASDRLFMTTRADDKMQLVSTDLAGGAKRTHFAGELVSGYAVAPDGRNSAFIQNYEAHVLPLMPGDQALDIDATGKVLPITRVSASGASYVNWSMDGARLHWSMGPTLYTAERDRLFPSAPMDENAPKFVPPATGLDLSMPVEAAQHDGTYALTGGRIVTMAGAGGGIIDDGVIVVRGNRIASVGARAATTLPAGIRTIDMAGKTIVPGYIDAHAHGPQGEDELVPQQNWSLLQNLALGTTTIHDPSSSASEIFVAAEMQRAGLLTGPRIFSTGEIIYGARAADVYAKIDSYEDALAHVRRLKAQGAHSVKNYNQPRREQRQMVVAAARAENMQVVAEGGSLYGMDMNLIADGNSTLEHNIPLETFYADVVQMFGQSDTNYTPTLVVSYGGLAGDPYWRQATNVWEHPLLVHTPTDTLLAATARVTKAPESNFVDDDNAREAKKIADAGKLVAIGAHGQQAGIGTHWELWSFARGGMSPVEALAKGTIDAARSLGMERDIGSIEPGKLADLVVLDADPTADIRNSDKIARVVLGGRMYDARTMNEVETGDARRMPYWWQ